MHPFVFGILAEVRESLRKYIVVQGLLAVLLLLCECIAVINVLLIKKNISYKGVSARSDFASVLRLLPFLSALFDPRYTTPSHCNTAYSPHLLWDYSTELIDGKRGHTCTTSRPGLSGAHVGRTAADKRGENLHRICTTSRPGRSEARVGGTIGGPRETRLPVQPRPGWEN